MGGTLRAAVFLGGLLFAWACDNVEEMTTPVPAAPFEATRLCHGTYPAPQRAQWFQTATPTVMGVSGAVYIDDDEGAQCLRIGVVDRPAGEAVERALATIDVPRDAAIIELTDPIRFAGQ